jgi:hypothetical protein
MTENMRKITLRVPESLIECADSLLTTINSKSTQRGKGALSRSTLLRSAITEGMESVLTAYSSLLLEDLAEDQRIREEEITV